MRLFDPDPGFGSPAGALAQAGDDWCRNSIPLEIKSNPIGGYGAYQKPCIE